MMRLYKYLFKRSKEIAPEGCYSTNSTYSTDINNLIAQWHNTYHQCEHPRNFAIDADEICAIAGSLYNRQFFNQFALQLANQYSQGSFSFWFCDALINEMMDIYNIINMPEMHNEISKKYIDPSIKSIQAPELFHDVYDAFDAGEYHRKEDIADNPIFEHTNPAIAEILSEHREKL